MMRGMRSDRLWALGGLIAAVVLLLLAWFLMISPQYAKADRLDKETSQQGSRLAALQQRISQLRQQNADLENYRAQSQRDRQALPNVAALADFLRELYAAENAVGVSVDSMVVGEDTTGAGAGTGKAKVLPVTLVTVGTAPNLVSFIDQIQQIQPRAALITSVNAVPEGQSSTFSGTLTLTLILRIFVSS